MSQEINPRQIDIEKSETSSQAMFLKYLPIYGSFIIFLGVLRLIEYYSSFNISIVQFLEFSEIITSFFDIITYVVILFAWNYLQSHLLDDKNDTQQKSEIKTQYLNEPSLKKRSGLLFRHSGGTVIGGLFGFWLIVLAGVIWGKVSSWYFLYVFLFAAGLYLILFIVSEAEAKHRQLGSSKQAVQFTYLIIACLLITGTLAFSTYGEVSQVKEYKKYFGVTILLTDSTKLVSDSNQYFIGKTQNYLFFYHEREKITDVIPINRLRQLSFPPAMTVKKI